MVKQNGPSERQENVLRNLLREAAVRWRFEGNIVSWAIAIEYRRDRLGTPMGHKRSTLRTGREEKPMELDLHGAIAPPRDHLLKERLMSVAQCSRQIDMSGKLAEWIQPSIHICSGKMVSRGGSCEGLRDTEYLFLSVNSFGCHRRASAAARSICPGEMSTAFPSEGRATVNNPIDDSRHYSCLQKHFNPVVVTTSVYKFEFPTYPAAAHRRRTVLLPSLDPQFCLNFAHNRLIQALVKTCKLGGGEIDVVKLWSILPVLLTIHVFHPPRELRLEGFFSFVLVTFNVRLLATTKTAKQGTNAFVLLWSSAGHMNEHCSNGENVECSRSKKPDCNLKDAAWYNWQNELKRLFRSDAQMTVLAIDVPQLLFLGREAAVRGFSKVQNQSQNRRKMPKKPIFVRAARTGVFPRRVGQC
ncbi:hypothetical protein B0H14DRAFT_3740902 [Mycena olivaceomarginata]|nr:hypothetical protein B0H14DRAFT_3740902 [Mycena olivaceomarginata]